MKRVFVLFAILAHGCGATGDAGGGASHLPVSGAGPFAPISADEPVDWSPPVIVSDVLADLDDPYVVTAGSAIGIWLTAHRNGVSRIEHADLYDFKQGFGDLFLAIEPDQPWEGSGLSSPSIVWDAQWLLFYEGGGAIGWATAPEPSGGHGWTKAPGPALVANTLEEGSALTSPSAVRVGDRLRVYYVANGAVWAAEAPFDDVLAGRATTFTRLDADPATPARDPVIAQPPFGTAITHLTARAANTPAGRVRHDLYFTVSQPKGTMPATTCGFASSFTGADFALAPTPILPAMVTARNCAETPYEDVALLFYTQRSGARDAVGLARAP
jgi:hypothetical protein